MSSTLLFFAGDDEWIASEWIEDMNERTNEVNKNADKQTNFFYNQRGSDMCIWEHSIHGMFKNKLWTWHDQRNEYS